MEDNTNYLQALQAALNTKKNWYNEVQMGEILNEYRLLHTCTKNIYDMVSKKSLISEDPYRLDKRITEIVVPDTEAFPESDEAKELGTRFSDYEIMLDFICTYYKFSIEQMSIGEVRKLLEFNNCFDWKNITVNSPQSNNRSLASILNMARRNAPGVIISMINDSITKNGQCIDSLNSKLNELGVFLREVFKGRIRFELMVHPDFNKEKAFSSPESELAEIKRLYTKVIGKKPFYSDLVNEIIEEDQSSNKDKLQQMVLKKLEVKGKVVQEKKQKTGPDPRKLLMDTVFALGGLAPTLMQLSSKLSDNFTHYYSDKKGFLASMGRIFRQAFKVREKEHFVNVKVIEAKTGAIRIERVAVSELLVQVAQKAKIYNGIANKAAEYQKIDSSSTEAVTNFVNHQISECQTLYTTINALDTFFKTEVDIMIRSRMKGMQIELSSMRNSIINVNKKRGEYVSSKEEIEQMKKLGIADV